MTATILLSLGALAILRANLASARLLSVSRSGMACRECGATLSVDYHPATSLFEARVEYVCIPCLEDRERNLAAQCACAACGAERAEDGTCPACSDDGVDEVGDRIPNYSEDDR